LLVSRNEYLRDAGRPANARVALARVQSLIARQVGDTDATSADVQPVTTAAATIREPKELLSWTVPWDARAERFIYPGTRAWLVEPDREPWLSGQGARLAAVGVFGMLASIAVIAVRRGWCRDALWQWPETLAVAAGLAWWLWLTPSLMGWALIALVVLGRYGRRWSGRNRPTPDRSGRSGDGQQAVS